MRVSPPCIVTPRLLAGVNVDGAFVSIEYSPHQEHDGRTTYRYHIDIPSLGVDYSCDDLRSGCNGGSLQEGLESLLTFLSACGEGYNYAQRTGRESDNTNLFPAYVAEWAAQHADELSMLATELEETEGAIEE